MPQNAILSELVNTFEMPGIGKVDIRFCEDFNAIEDQWKALEGVGNCSVYQRFDWINSWTQRVAKPARIKTCIIVGSTADKTQFIIPLGLRNRGPFTIASWLGDSHSNFHMGLFSEEILTKASPEKFREMIMDIIHAVPGVDVLEFCCQPVSWGEYTNPLSYLRWQESHNHGFALNLESDFRATLDRKNGPRKRKKHRWQVNKLKSVGGATLRLASTEDEVNAFIDVALEQLENRFSKAGIWNRFEDEGIEEFFRNLAITSLNEKEPTLEIFGLEIDGKIRATFAGGVHQSQFSGCFISTANDEYAYISPGEMIIYLVIEECCKRGYKIFDLGRGEERYKTSWCDKIIAMFETNIAITKFGLAYSGYERGKLTVKRIVRNNDTLWEWAKKIRTRLYGRV